MMHDYTVGLSAAPPPPPPQQVGRGCLRSLRS